MDFFGGMLWLFDLKKWGFKILKIVMSYKVFLYKFELDVSIILWASNDISAKSKHQQIHQQNSNIVSITS